MRVLLPIAPAVVALMLEGCAGSTHASDPTPEKTDSASASGPAKRPLGPGAARGGAQKDLDAAIKAANAGDLDAAIASSRAAIEKDPNLEKAYLLLGSACAMKGDGACEKDAYDRGTAALPQSAALLDERGLLLLEGGDKTGAVADLERANELSKKKEPKIMADLAYAYAFVDRLDDGDKLAREARTLDPKCFDAASAHGEILLRKRDGKGAADAFHAAAALTEDPEVKKRLDQQLSIALALDGKYAEALALDEKLIAESPADPMHHVRAAEALMKLDRAKDAAEHMQAAVKLAPEDTRFLGLLLKTQEKAKDKKGAEATKKKLNALGVKP